MIDLPSIDFLPHIGLIGQVNDCGSSLLPGLHIGVAMEMVGGQLVRGLVSLKNTHFNNQTREQGS